MNSIQQYKDFADSTKYLFLCGDLFKTMLNDFKIFIKSKSISIIQDENTKDVTGTTFVNFCSKNSIKVASVYTFSSTDGPDASYKNVEIIKEFLKEYDSVPIVIGSGTLNDLVKRASFELNRKYGIIATAASVDGYASDGAALLYNNFKQTMECPAPEFIGVDTNILANAPIELSSAGYADLLAKNPAGSDWILADSLNIDNINKPVWELIQKDLLTWTENPQKLAAKDSDTLSDLMTGLTVSGFAMQLMKRSRPVSGAEHLMSHVWEMEDLVFNEKHVSHGFKVAIGSLSSIVLLETLVNININNETINNALLKWPTWEQREQSIIDKFPNLSDINNLLKINKQKYINKEQLNQRLMQFLKVKDSLLVAIKKHKLSYNDYKNRLQLAGCPIKPEDIGLTKDRVIKTYSKAQMLRNRFSILDLVYELGLLDYCEKLILENKEYLT